MRAEIDHVGAGLGQGDGGGRADAPSGAGDDGHLVGHLEAIENHWRVSLGQVDSATSRNGRDATWAGQAGQAGRVEGRPSLRWSHETVRSTLTLATIRLLSMVSTNGPQLLGVGPVVALEEVDPELPHLVRVVDDLGPAHQLHAAELLVVVAVLEHAGDPRVAPQVDRLLRLGLGLDGDGTVEEPVPHGHGVDGSVVVERAHGHRPALVEEGVDLLGCHGDQIALLDAVPHLLLALLLAGSALRLIRSSGGAGGSVPRAPRGSVTGRRLRRQCRMRSVTDPDRRLLRLHRQHLPVAHGRRGAGRAGRRPPAGRRIRPRRPPGRRPAPAPAGGTPASPWTLGPARRSSAGATPIGGTGPRPSRRRGSPPPIWWCAWTAATSRPCWAWPGRTPATTATRSGWCCCAGSTPGPAGAVDVPDPYYGDDADFETCLDLVEAGCRGLVPHLVGRLGAGRGRPETKAGIRARG